MALNIPSAVATLTTITKAWSDAIRDSLLWLATDAPHCRVYNSANISLTNSTVTALTFDSERYDVGGCHSTSVNTGRITVPSGAGGKWEFKAHVEFASNSSGYRYIGIRVNGGTVVAYTSAAAVNGIATILHLTTDYAMSAGDYMEVIAFQNSGGALNASAVSAYSPEFSGKWVRT